MTPKKANPVPTLVLDAVDAKYVCDIALAAVSTEDVTPVICAGQFTVDDDGVLSVVATDRYRIHRALIKPRLVTPGFVALLPRKALQWISSNANFYGRPGRVTGEPVVEIIWSPGAPIGQTGDPIFEINIKDASPDGNTAKLTYSDSGTRGNFPPVGTLIDHAREAEETTAARIKPEFFSRTRAMAPHPHYAPTLKFTKAEKGEKPGPLLVTFRDWSGLVVAEALIQPNLNSDD